MVGVGSTGCGEVAVAGGGAGGVSVTSGEAGGEIAGEGRFGDKAVGEGSADTPPQALASRVISRKNPRRRANLNTPLL